MSDFNKLDSFFQSSSDDASSHKKKLNHAQRVRLAKLVLPCIAAFLLSLLVIIPQLKQHINEIALDITRPQSGEIEKLHVENTIFQITDKDNHIHNITADNIDETEPGSKLIKIINPEGTMPFNQTAWVNIKSPTGYFDQNLNTLTLTENVDSFYSDGIMVEVPEMTYDFNASKAYSKHPVKSEGFFGNLKSEGFDFDANTGVLIFTGKTNINMDEKAIQGNKK